MHLFPLPRRLAAILISLAMSCLGAATGSAIIHLDSGDPALYTSTPGDNSGWQYEGLFGAYLGTPIAPLYFLTAKHIQRASDTFVFHGESFQVSATGYGDDGTDLQIWKVDHPFSTWAPVYQRIVVDSEKGQELHVFGRGTQRGGEIYAGGSLRGWYWAGSDYLERWGSNLVFDVVNGPDWPLLQVAFDSPGSPGESHLSVGDSGGGLFILQNGLWRLAGINYGVDDVFTTPDAASGFAAAIFDAYGYYQGNDDGTFTLITHHQPTSFYSTQVSARLTWIQGIVGSLATLPPEDFAAWRTAYFTPAEIADGTIAGPAADRDGDGVSNLLEFAFNLDPTYPEPVVMTAGTGLRGLPLVRLEGEDSERRLTVEFVRRTAGSGAGLTYAVQFTSDLPSGWQTGGSESVTAINERWERVKVTDSAAAGRTAQARFARVLVSQEAAGSGNAAARADRPPIKAVSTK